MIPSNKQVMIINLTQEELQSLIEKALDKIMPKWADSHSKAEEIYIDFKQTKEITKLSTPTINMYVKKGLFKKYKFGGRVVFKKEEVLAGMSSIAELKK